MRRYNADNYKKIAILGSFGKHYEVIVSAANDFIQDGFEVLVPKLDGFKDENNGFILLNGDETNDPRVLETKYIEECIKADCVYVCDKDGYIGTTVAFELGILVTLGQEVYFMEKPQDQLFGSMMNIQRMPIYSTETLIKMMNIHNTTFNSRDWFDSYDVSDDSNFYLTKKLPATIR